MGAHRSFFFLSLFIFSGLNFYSSLLDLRQNFHVDPEKKRIHTRKIRPRKSVLLNRSQKYSLACVEALYFGGVARITGEPHAKKDASVFSRAFSRGSLRSLLGTFSTDGFQDGYGELDRAGTGDTRRRPRKSPRK